MADFGRSPDGSGFRPYGSSLQAVSPVPASIPNACDYWDRGWACREGGYLWDEDGDGYDPSDCTYPCPSCNTREYLELGVEFAQTLSESMWQFTSGAEQWRYRVDQARLANPTAAAAILAEIGPVECLDWADANAPHFDHTITVIENVAAQGIEAQRAETTEIGSVEDESPVPQGCAQTQSSTPDNKDKPNA